MKRALIFGLALLLSATAVAEAARTDDFEFAQGLVERKLYDLAQEEFEGIIDDTGRSASESADGELGLALLLRARANDASRGTERATREVLELYSSAKEKLDGFLENHPNHPKLTDARFEAASLLQEMGIFLTGRLKTEEDASMLASGKRDAENAFDRAIDVFSDVADRLEDLAAAGGPEAREYDWSARRAEFQNGVCHYYKGILYAPGSSERRGTLGVAVSLLTDFVWENEDNILGGYAYLYLGLGKKELDEPDEALEFLGVAASNYPIPDPAQYPEDHRIWTDLYYQAYFKYAEYCNQLDGEYLERAIELVSHMLERLPDALERRYGHYAILELARAYKGMGTSSKAALWATRVSERGEALGDWGLATAFEANKLLNEIIPDTERWLLTPPILFKAAMGKMSAKEWNLAIRAFQKVIRVSSTGEEEKQFLIPAWMRIGESYYRSSKFLEAYFAYDRVVTLYRNMDRRVAGDAAYFRYRAATARHGESRSKADEELKKKARRAFASEFKDHPRSADLQYYEGSDLIADGDARVGEDRAAGQDIYRQAIASLQNVKKTSILYAKAKARIGEVRYKLAQYEEALTQFARVEEYVGDTKNVTTDQEQQTNRLQALALGTYYGSLCHSKLGEWEKTLARLDGYEREFGDDNVEDFHPPVMSERIRANVKLDRLADAEKEMLRLIERFPDSPRIPYAYHLCGMAFHEASETDADAKPEQWKAHLTKAALYVSRYLEMKTEPKPTADDWRIVGLWCYKLEDWPKAEEFFGRALVIYNARLDAIKGDTPEKKEIFARVDAISVKLSKLLLTQRKYADAKRVFEELLIPDEGARARVLEILVLRELSRSEIKELMSKIRAVPSFIEGLADAYRNLRTPDDLRRGLTLLGILSRADSKDQYTERWWGWQLKILRIYLDYGILKGDVQALETIVRLYGPWKSLGVLGNSGLEREINKMHDLAQQELQKLR